MTKRIAELSAEDKAYDGHFTFGANTDSHDLEMPLIPVGPTDGLSLDSLRETALAFTGQIEQLPPNFSAKKVGGQKAYVAARKGKDIGLSPVPVQVHRFDITAWEDPKMSFDILCSKGTYIRSFARDLGKVTGCGAHLSALRRTASGAFNLDECWSVEEFEARISTLPDPISAPG